MTAARLAMPHRMVIDPNVFIWALMAKPGSPNLAIAQAVTIRKVVLVACPTLLQELSDVANRAMVKIIDDPGYIAAEAVPELNGGPDGRRC